MLWSNPNLITVALSGTIVGAVIRISFRDFRIVLQELTGYTFDIGDSYDTSNKMDGKILRNVKFDRGISSGNINTIMFIPLKH